MRGQPSPAAQVAIVEVYNSAGPTGSVPANSVSAAVRNEMLLLAWVSMDGTNLRITSRGLSAVARLLTGAGRGA